MGFSGYLQLCVKLPLPITESDRLFHLVVVVRNDNLVVHQQIHMLDHRKNEGNKDVGLKRSYLEQVGEKGGLHVLFDSGHESSN